MCSSKADRGCPALWTICEREVVRRRCKGSRDQAKRSAELSLTNSAGPISSERPLFGHQTGGGLVARAARRRRRARHINSSRRLRHAEVGRRRVFNQNSKIQKWIATVPRFHHSIIPSFRSFKLGTPNACKLNW